MAATAICSISYSSSRPPIISRFSSYRIPRHFRHRRRRKSTSICIRNESGDDFLTSFLSHLSQPFNSLNSLPLTALGFASGLALSLPKLNFKPRQLGEWIFITSPTPFNRFVLLRCPSISFEGAELLQDVNEKLVKQERHFVRLDSGRIPSQFAGIGWGVGDQKLEYSRVCVGTDDGGVIALDWPADLDLNEEHGLDSTVLIVPGSAEGSMGENVKDFVLQCLNRGLFPVVMNPRGCAGSPLTTPRLFTAADSDDVSSAIQFLSRTRPWSTFMAVGWGFGANMLTKYLAEVGEKTPLTAATCIDNPFDLEEATRTCSGAAVNQKLTGGLINILKSNKGLFQGRSKDFDVDSALSAKSSQQLTIFYGGQVIVFNDLPAHKAKEIMEIAARGVAQNSNTNTIPAVNTTNTMIVADKNTLSPSSLNEQSTTPIVTDLPIARKASLHRFLEKRKDRIKAKAPYNTSKADDETPLKRDQSNSWLGLAAAAAPRS